MDRGQALVKKPRIRSSYYPPDYVPPIKREYADGTYEYLIPIQNQIKIALAIKQNQ